MSQQTGCVKHLALVVRVATQESIKDSFLALVPLESASAESLHECVKSVFNGANIPYKQNIIGFAADGASVMMGARHSLSKLLKDDIPNLFIMKCVCHSFHLCASKACNKLPSWLEDMIRDVYNYFLSPKQTAAFKDFQEFANVKPHKLLHPCQTRWLSLHSAVKRLLEQLPALQLFFTQAALEDRVIAADTILQRLRDPFTAQFPNLVSENDLNEIDGEWRLLKNTELNVEPDINVYKFWQKVGDLKKGDDSPLFPLLGNFMKNCCVFLTLVQVLKGCFLK
ncbi:uncharacterized protein LOC123507659 [Portunus trituberculatus]|uniref:uncharacterized protein LOC123507659 n=1 Tax=Portunus trituberculatus TaxID=210409 RepID=UPI001E1CDEB3|nr:uncharacterized protein LOC123507659 [Portunus trituberculatus]